MPKGGFDLSKLKELKLCKYAQAINFNMPIECEYKNSMFKSCPTDSGTDKKCNNKCYEYELKEN